MKAKINGLALSKHMLARVADLILTEKLKYQNIPPPLQYPRLAIILQGHNPASLSYIERKRKTAKNTHIKSRLFHEAEPSLAKLQHTIAKLNHDPKYHGILLQLPLPACLLDYEQ